MNYKETYEPLMPLLICKICNKFRAFTNIEIIEHSKKCISCPFKKCKTHNYIELQCFGSIDIRNDNTFKCVDKCGIYHISEKLANICRCKKFICMKCNKRYTSDNASRKLPSNHFSNGFAPLFTTTCCKACEDKD